MDNFLSSQWISLPTRRRFPNGLFLHALCDTGRGRVQISFFNPRAPTDVRGLLPLLYRYLHEHIRRVLLLLLLLLVLLVLVLCCCCCTYDMSFVVGQYQVPVFLVFAFSIFLLTRTKYKPGTWCLFFFSFCLFFAPHPPKGTYRCTGIAAIAVPIYISHALALESHPRSVRLSRCVAPLS